MMAKETGYSVGEAAVLSQVSLDKVRREIEHGVLPVEHDGTARVRLPISDLIYLGLLRRLEDEEVSVGRERRARLVRALRRQLPAAVPGKSSWNALVRRELFRVSAQAWQTEVSTTVMVDWPALARDLGPRLSAFERGRTRIVEDPEILGGEPVFKGTRLAVRHVGGMRLRGEGIEAICADYPDLTADDVEFAAMYAQSHPRVGRPRRVDE